MSQKPASCQESGKPSAMSCSAWCSSDVSGTFTFQDFAYVSRQATSTTLRQQSYGLPISSAEALHAQAETSHTFYKSFTPPRHAGLIGQSLQPPAMWQTRWGASLWSHQCWTWERPWETPPPCHPSSLSCLLGLTPLRSCASWLWSAAWAPSSSLLRLVRVRSV